MEARFNPTQRHSAGTPPHGLILPLPKTSGFLPPSLAADITPSSTDSSASPLKSFPSCDLEFISLTSRSYTSLKDILPATSVVNSPTTAGCEIPIRNRLVKQAAWAYLQPVPASPSSSTAPFLLCLPVGNYNSLLTPINAVFRLFNCGLFPAFSRVFHRLLIHLRIRTSSNNQ